MQSCCRARACNPGSARHFGAVAPKIPSFLASLQPTWQIKGQPRAWKPRSQACECRKEPQLCRPMAPHAPGSSPRVRAPFPLQGISQVWLPLQSQTIPQLCKAESSLSGNHRSPHNSHFSPLKTQTSFIHAGEQEPAAPTNALQWLPGNRSQTRSGE